MTNTATLIRPSLSGWKGDAALYKVAPAVPYDGGVTEHVVVSSINLADSYDQEPNGLLAMLDAMAGISRTEETMVFPADAEGNALDWGELAMVDIRDHAAALDVLGYEIAE